MTCGLKMKHSSLTFKRLVTTFTHRTISGILNQSMLIKPKLSVLISN